MWQKTTEQCLQLQAHSQQRWAQYEQLCERRDARRRADHAALSTLHAVCSCIVWRVHIFTLAQGRSHLSFHFHPIHAHVSSSLSVVLFLLTFYFLLYFTFLLFLFFFMTDNDSMNLNTLCNFANGTFVTLDDCLPDTSSTNIFVQRDPMMKFKASRGCSVLIWRTMTFRTLICDVSMHYF